MPFLNRAAHAPGSDPIATRLRTQLSPGSSRASELHAFFLPVDPSRQTDRNKPAQSLKEDGEEPSPGSGIWHHLVVA